MPAKTRRIEMPNSWCRKRNESATNFHKHSIATHNKKIPGGRVKSLTNRPTLWQDIVTEDMELENYIRKEKQKNLPNFECTSNYLKRELFSSLIPAFEKICTITLKRCVLYQNVRFFSFIDALAEVLYNTNPARSDRKDKWLSVHLVYQDSNRPYYPYFWFLTPNEAAIMIQALVRGFLIRRKYDLETMKEERRKIQEGIEKQKRCYNALKKGIENIQTYL